MRQIKLSCLFWLIISLLSITSFGQNEDFANITIKASGLPITIKVNGTIIDKLDPRNMLIINIQEGETKLIILEDSEGKKYAKEIKATKEDKGKNFFVQFPSNKIIDTGALINPTQKGIPTKANTVSNKINQSSDSIRKTNANNSVIKSSTLTNTGSKESALKIKLAATLLNEKLTSISEGKINLDDTAVILAYSKAKTEQDNAAGKAITDTSALMKSIRIYEAMKSGKRPLSKNLVVALNANRATDLPYFVNKNNIGELNIDDKPLLLQALENNRNEAIIKFIAEVANGNEKIINPTNYTFSQPYENYYLTPLAKACINGDTNIINILIDANARFYPKGLEEEHAIDQAKFLWEQFGWNKDVRLLISRRIPDFPNPDKDKTDAVNGIETNMIFVEGGSFKMGCKGDRADCGNIWPLIDMKVRSFYILRYEITQSLWETIMESNPSINATCENCPVENISWEDVQLFIQKVNNLSEKKFRLPTEQEWEFASKGGLQSNNYKFSGSNYIDSIGWYKLNSSSTQPVGKKPPNELGLYDMTGNVFEWCSNFSSDNLEIYLNAPQGASNGQEKIIRGGSYAKGEYSCGVIRRNNFYLRSKSPEIGFRLVYDAP